MNYSPPPPTVPIIPTFLYAMEHPSPEPQTAQPAQPSLHPLYSLNAPQMGTVPSQAPFPRLNVQTSSLISQTSQLPQPNHGAPVRGTYSQQTLRSSSPASSLLMSLFNNATFSLQEIQTEPTPNTEPTDQTSLTTDLQINETTEVEGHLH